MTEDSAASAPDTAPSTTPPSGDTSGDVPETPSRKPATSSVPPPPVQPSEERGKDLAGKKPPDAADYPVIKAARILVVDDSRPMRMLLTKTLKQYGADPDEAGNGQIGLEKLRVAKTTTRPFRLVLLDLMMPVMDGHTTLREMRQDPDLKKTPVVIVTTRTEREAILQSARFGISGYIVKPFTTQRILDVAQTALKSAPKVSVLTLEHVTELRKIIRTTAARAVRERITTVTSVEEEPISRAALDYLQSVIPEETGDESQPENAAGGDADAAASGETPSPPAAPSPEAPPNVTPDEPDEPDAPDEPDETTGAEAETRSGAGNEG